MNGAESLLRTLVGSGVEVCFGNPGTSEMHFVAALDRVEGMRAVLGLFEGVVTGAADGYGRMAGKPAARRRRSMNSCPELPAPAERKQPAVADVPESSERFLRVTADNLDRLLGLAGESLVESRWLKPFSESLLRLKRLQAETGRALGSRTGSSGRYSLKPFRSAWSS